MHRVLLPLLIAAALLAAGCARVVEGVPAAAESAPATTTTTAPPTTPPPASDGGGCTVTLTETGTRLMSRNAAGRLTSSDEGTFVICDGGPSVQVQWDPGVAVVLTLDGAVTEVAPGEQGVTVGGYGVEVTEVSAERAVFTLRPQ